MKTETVRKFSGVCACGKAHVGRGPDGMSAEQVASRAATDPTAAYVIRCDGCAQPVRLVVAPKPKHAHSANPSSKRRRVGRFGR